MKSSCLAMACAAVTSLWILTGCATMSTPPQPMDSDQLQSAVDKATPQQQIDWINRSPASAEDKAAKIKAVREKFGLADTGSASPPAGH